MRDQPMITLPVYHISLAAIITLFAVSDLRRRRLYSAFLQFSILAYLYYCILIDINGLYYHIPSVYPIDSDFFMKNSIVVGLFFIFYQLGRMALLPFKLFNSNFRASRFVGNTSRNMVLLPLLFGVLLVALTADGWWIFHPYPQNKGQFALFSLGGASVLANVLILVGLHRALVDDTYRKLAIAVFSMAAAHYALAGDRGSFVFLAIGAYLINLQFRSSITFKTIIEITLVAYLCVLFFQLIVELRSHRYVLGAESDASFLEEINLLPQAIAHMMYGIEINNQNINVYTEGTATFLLKIITQIVPSFLLRPLGVELYNGPWLLADYYIHGGGFFVPAELMFIGGYYTLIIISFYFGVLSELNDRLLLKVSQNNDSLIIVVVVIAAAANAYTMFYGVQAFHRMLTLPLIFYLGRSAFRWKKGNRLRRDNLFRA